jgi:hypothetical protein
VLGVPSDLGKHWPFALFLWHFVAFLPCIPHVFALFYAVFRPVLGVLLRPIFAPFHPQFDTLNRAVLTATLPVLSVTDTFIRTGSAVSAIAVPAANANEIPLFAAIVRLPCLVGTAVSLVITATADIVSAASAAHVTVAELMVSALVSIGPKSA